MRRVIEIPKYGQLFQELLPYIPDASDRTVLDYIVSDWNEILKAVRSGNDIQPALGLMEFIVGTTNQIIEYNRIDRDILKIWCTITDDLLYTLSRYPGWSVKSYQLINCNSGYGAEIDKATVVLEEYDTSRISPDYIPKLDELAYQFIEHIIKQIESS